MLTRFEQIQYLPESEIFPVLEHLLLLSNGEINSASRLIVPPLIVSLYFEDDNKNMSGMALSVLGDGEHPSSTHPAGLELEAWFWLLVPALPRQQLIPFHDSQPEA